MESIYEASGSLRCGNFVFSSSFFILIDVSFTAFYKAVIIHKASISLATTLQFLLQAYGMIF